MPRILRNLRIDDVSSVDVGAGRGVRVVLTKRDQSALKKHRDGVPDLYGKPLAFGSRISNDALDYLKREVSQDERENLASEGKALPDGSFPIANVGDLKNAIQAVGRAKDPGKAKAHIKARAKDLGREDLIPENWQKRLVTKAEFMAEVMNIAERNALASLAKNAMDFGDAYERNEVMEDVGCLLDEIREAMCALDCSIQSILCDDDIGDKRPAIETSFKQFQRYIAGRELEQHDPEGEALANKRDEDMTALSPQVQKILEEMVAKSVGEANAAKDAEIAKLKDEVVLAKMSDKHKNYHDSMSDEMEKGKFKNMSADERDQYMERAKKRADDDPIVKSLRAENDDLRKRLDALEGDKELDIAKRDAREMGLAQTDSGELLMKSRKGDRAAHDEIMKRMTALAKSNATKITALERTSKAFTELGHNQRSADGTGLSVIDEFNALAGELRKKDPSLSPAQAFNKVYNDPAHAELRQRENDERMAKIHHAA